MFVSDFFLGSVMTWPKHFFLKKTYALLFVYRSFTLLNHAIITVRNEVAAR